MFRKRLGIIAHHCHIIFFSKTSGGDENYKNPQKHDTPTTMTFF